MLLYFQSYFIKLLRWVPIQSVQNFKSTQIWKFSQYLLTPMPRGNFLVHKTFLELSNKTALERWVHGNVKKKKSKWLRLACPPDSKSPKVLRSLIDLKTDSKTLFCCEAPEMFCGLWIFTWFSISMRVSKSWLNIYFCANLEVLHCTHAAMQRYQICQISDITSFLPH